MKMDSDTCLFILVLILVVALAFGGIVWLDKAECDAKTQNIGFNHSWSILTGCMIEVEIGKWMPLDNYYWKDQK